MAVVCVLTGAGTGFGVVADFACLRGWVGFCVCGLGAAAVAAFC